MPVGGRMNAAVSNAHPKMHIAKAARSCVRGLRDIVFRYSTSLPLMLSAIKNVRKVKYLVCEAKRTSAAALRVLSAPTALA